MRLPLLSKHRDTKAELARLREERDLFTNGTRVPAWSTMMAGQTYSAVNVTLANAVGLPAVGAAIRLLSETISQLPLNVYRGYGADKRLADQTWQYRLLNYLPGGGDFSPFDLFSDIVASLETTGNAFVHKVKVQGNLDLPAQVIALVVIDPARVQVRRESGEKIFTVRDDKGHKEEYSAADILHVRGFTVNGSDMGLSPISLHRQKLGSIIAQDEWLARHYGQGTHHGGAIELPEGIQLTPDQAQQLSEQWARQNAGLQNAGKPLVLQNGATFNKTTMTMTDSQFVESAQLSLVEVANIFRIPPSFLGHTGHGKEQVFEQDNIRFYTLSIQPRLKRIELAFRSDPDLFPQVNLYPEFDTRPLLRTDAKTKAEVEHLQIQDGSRLIDEVRADRGEGPLPPIPTDPTQTPGMVPQLTPVGGAPNPEPPATQEPQNNQRYLTVEEFRHVMTALMQARDRDVVFEEGAFQVRLPELKPPDVHVQPANILVQTPEITVESPEVTVEPAQVNVTVEKGEARRKVTYPDGRTAIIEPEPISED